MFSSKSERSGAELLPSSSEAFAERMDMLASTVSSTAAALAKTDGEIASLRRELGSGLARLEELTVELRSRARASDVHELQKQLGSLTFEHSRTPEPKRVDDLSSKVAVLAERVNTLAATVSTTAASVAGRDGEVAALRRQFSEGPQGPAVDEALLRRVQDAVAASASASMRIESYGDEVTALASRVDLLAETLTALTRRVEADEKERLTLAASVAEAAASRWREVERSLGDLADRLDAAEQHEAALASELGRVTSLWPAALRSLEGRVEELANAPRPPASDPGLPTDDLAVLGALRSLEQRMQRADESAREDREAVLDRLERLAGGLEAGSSLVTAGAEIVPLRAEPVDA